MSYKFDSIKNTISFLKDIAFEDSHNKYRALYLGWLGHKNLGDEALYYCIKKMLLSKIIFHPSNEFETLFFKNSLIKAFDIHFLGGGTLINRSDNIINALVEYKQHIPRCFVFGAGVANYSFWNEFEDRVDRSIEWREYLNSCIFLGVRGPDSLLAMQQLGVSKAIMTGDPVLYLGRDTIIEKRQKKRIGLNFGNTKNILWGESDQRVEDVMAELIRLLLERHWEVSFFNVYANDTGHYFKFVERNAFKDKIRFFDASNCSMDSALAYFDTVDVFVGEKLHASVFAACTHTPFIMLEYRPKCLDFMRSINYEKYNFRTDSVHADEIICAVDELYHTTGDIQKHLYSNVSYLKNILISSANNIAKGDII